MNDLKVLFQNRFMWVLLIILASMFGVALGGKILIDKVADRVIQKLQKEYAPGPYAPGLDPDKVSPNWQRQSVRPSNPREERVSPSERNTPREWNSDWESQRRN